MNNEIIKPKLLITDYAIDLIFKPEDFWLNLLNDFIQKLILCYGPKLENNYHIKINNDIYILDRLKSILLKGDDEAVNLIKNICLHNIMIEDNKIIVSINLIKQGKSQPYKRQIVIELPYINIFTIQLFIEDRNNNAGLLYLMNPNYKIKGLVKCIKSAME